ncbi:DUF2987 domain-containing protein [Niveispirillum cyanobacteriorum]|nr:DUF2987 domain-containing protein [Niveispirillum cyanobacteriorum]GGE61124.1 hypothetical protein GCM10011317_18590 [Niveispirillum cyanobacteriorum]
MRLFLTTALVLSLAVPTAWSAVGTHTVPYRQFHDEMVKFYGQGHDHLALRLSVQPTNDKQPLDAPVTLVVTAPEGRVDLSVDADNAVDIPFRPDWVQAGAMVTVNQAAGTYKMKAQIGMKVTPGTTRIAYADVKAAFDQFDKLIEKEAGAVSFLAPSAKTLRLVCGKDCTVTLEGTKGARVLKADERGRVNVPNDKGLVKENPVLVVSQPVAYTVLTTKG